MKKISIGIPCFNEEENIELMYKAIKAQIMPLTDKYDFEIIFADNASTDCSSMIMQKIAKQDNSVKVILNQTNFGPERSGINCYRNASGDAYIGIPCDFQEPPEMIPQFIEQWENGYDIVWGQKLKSKESLIKYYCRNFFYRIIKLMSDTNQIEQVTGFGLMDRKVINTLLITQLQDPEYNARFLISEYGYNIKLLSYEQGIRVRGKSSYNFYSYFHFAVTSLVNTSLKPLHIMTISGFLISVLCILVSIFYFIYKLLYWDVLDLGLAPLIIGLFFISGVQLFGMGILGEYLAVLIRRTTKKPLVIEKEKINFSDNE